MSGCPKMVHLTNFYGSYTKLHPDWDEFSWEIFRSMLWIASALFATMWVGFGETLCGTSFHITGDGRGYTWILIAYWHIVGIQLYIPRRRLYTSYILELPKKGRWSSSHQSNRFGYPLQAILLTGKKWHISVHFTAILARGAFIAQLRKTHTTPATKLQLDSRNAKKKTRKPRKNQHGFWLSFAPFFSENFTPPKAQHITWKTQDKPFLSKRSLFYVTCVLFRGYSPVN